MVWFYSISTIVSYSMLNPLYTYILNLYDLVWFGLMAYHHWRLFNAKFSSYIFIKSMIWFVWVLWPINHSRLFDFKPSLYIYIKYILFGFGLVCFYGISLLEVI